MKESLIPQLRLLAVALKILWWAETRLDMLAHVNWQ